MNFNLMRPCGNCPFRRVGAIELHPGRLEQIIGGLLADDLSWFICHKTLSRGEYVDDADGHERYETGGTESQCVGAMVYLLKCDAPSVSMRMAAAFELLDFAALRALAGGIIEPLPR